MKRQWVKRLTAWLISLAMLFAFMPITTHAALNPDGVTGAGTYSDPYVVANWNGLKAALTTSGNNEGGMTVYVKIGESFEELYAAEIQIEPQGNCKDYVLDLNGKTVKVTTSANQPFTIKNGASLIITDSGEAGKIYDQSDKNQIFYVKNSSLMVFGGTFETTTSKYVIHSENSSLTLYHGTYIATDSDGATIYTHGSSTDYHFFGGTYISNSSSSSTPVIKCERALSDEADTANIWLSSTTGQIIFKRRIEGTILQCDSNNMKLVQGTKSDTFGYEWDGTWVEREINGYAILGTTFRVAYRTASKPVITSQPQSVTVNINQTATFTISVTNTDSYTWRVCDPETGQPYGNSWVESYADVSGWNSSTFTIKPKNTQLNGLAVNCILKNDAGYTYSNDAILTIINNKPVITSQPQSVTVNINETATFTISATNTDSYTWWVCDPNTGQPYGNSWVETHADVTGWNSSTFTIKPKNTQLNGLAVNCTLRNDAGYTYSNDAILTIINNKPVITSQPQDATVNLYGTATFTVTGTNVDSYQWYVADYDTGQPYTESFIEQYANVSGWNSSTFKITPKNIQLNGLGIYCRLSNDSGNTYSNTALLTVNEPTVQFTDVDTNSAFYEPIMWAVANNITTGTSTTTFSPNDKVTRAQVALFLWRAAGKPEPKSTTSPFVDVKNSGSTQTFYKAILWAAENKITSGTDETHFSPTATCSRAQIVTFLYRYAGSPAVTTTTNPFTDVSKTGYTSAFYDAIMWAVENKITTGITNTTFSPRTTCTRAQVVTFLYRLMM